MFALLGLDPAVLLSLALVFVLLVGATLALDSPRGRAQLRRFVWFRRFELLPPAELRHRGLIAVGFGVCCFAAVLTLRLFPPVGVWSAVGLASLAVIGVTLGAAMLERAGQLEG